MQKKRTKQETESLLYAFEHIASSIPYPHKMSKAEVLFEQHLDDIIDEESEYPLYVVLQEKEEFDDNQSVIDATFAYIVDDEVFFQSFEWYDYYLESMLGPLPMKVKKLKNDLNMISDNYEFLIDISKNEEFVSSLEIDGPITIF